MTDIRKPRVVVAGQVPPPILGQYVATADLIETLKRCERYRIEHLEFRFARSATDLRVPRFGKLLELTRIIGRAIAARARGRIDCLIYPVGGPSAVVAMRDIVLLPPLHALSDHTILLFHSGGHAEAWSQRRLWQRAAAGVYRRTSASVVLTRFGTRDPAALNITDVFVAPHQVPDTRDKTLIQRGSDTARLLYLGTIDTRKGIPDLLDAAAKLDDDFTLHLAGEPSPTYPRSRLEADIVRLGLQQRVMLSEVVTGRQKSEVMGRSDLLVFPSVHPGETFGLVLVEALMWGLPVVAADWRGTRDVVGDIPSELLAHPSPYLAASLEECLRHAFANRDRWTEWGTENRARYEKHFRPGSTSAFADAIDTVLAGNG